MGGQPHSSGTPAVGCRSASRRDRARRIGDPFAPRAGVDPRAGEPGHFHRQLVVAGGDARPALVNDGVERPVADERCELGAQRGRRLERAVGLRFCAYGRLVAPGMWPATGSSGSVSPRKRSGPRASISSSERDGRLATTASTSTVRQADARGVNVAAPAGGASVATGRPSAVHFAQPPSSTATASWPSQRSVHHSRDAYMPCCWS